MVGIFSQDVCLVNAERRISDAAHMFEGIMRNQAPSEKLKRAARSDMLDYEREAREFYAEAEKSGWVGDVDALIAQFWMTYLPQVSADTIMKLRQKAMEEAVAIRVA